MSAYIKIEDITKTYLVGDQQVHALNGVNMEIDKGDFVVLLGHSGSGKTTLVSTIGGLTKPTAGTVSVDGTNIWQLKDSELSKFRNKNIGFMFQAFSLLPSLSSLNNVVMPAIFSKNNGTMDRDALRDKAVSILTNLEMKNKIESFPSELSGGEQRRVAIARALINDPDIILADEPTGELDIRTEQEVIEIFRMINEDYGKTVIVVSHTLTWMEKAKKVVIMKNGCVSQDVEDPAKVLMEEEVEL
jgi:ABC-type lipoprotein export system ATPase subunit